MKSENWVWNKGDYSRRVRMVSAWNSVRGKLVVYHSIIHSVWRAENERHREEIIRAVRATANEQGPFNVQGVRRIMF